MKASKLAGKLKNHYYFPAYSGWVLLFLLIAVSMIYGYHNILFMKTQGVHQWRQADCLSITMNYYQDGNGFFEPAIHNLGVDGTGKTAAEFPLAYYSVAQLWKLFGQHEFIFRLFNLLIFFAGLFALFKSTEHILKDSVISMGVVILLFSSPTIVYFANNFLMNVPALSLALIGLYFFYRFYNSSKNRFLYLFALAFALAGLFKVSSLLSFCAIAGIFILELFNVKLKNDGRVFNHPVRQAIPIALVFIIQIVWYLYARNYNLAHNSGNFLIGILPVWELSPEQIKEVLSAIYGHIKWDYFRSGTQLTLVIMLLLVLINPRKVNRFLYLLTAFISIGFLVFTGLFFQALKHHDYYAIDLFILAPVVLITFSEALRRNYTGIFKSVIFRIIIVAFLIHNVDFARRRMADRYNDNGWQNKEYAQYLKPFEDIGPYFKEIGIEPDDNVICLPDNAINISLYMMNRKGWTNYNVGMDKAKIENKIGLGAKYLIIYKDEVYRDKNILQFTTHKIGEFKNVDIYELGADE
ncbi:MAG: hypothetical protein B6I19_03200 [Bacteroidetes bacterium 4572_114]|nr:MAG: hypothetical protein B6I19_03200 [Bacteroidetes bacterium 4572_114]